jgi:hypothetical protein
MIETLGSLHETKRNLDVSVVHAYMTLLLYTACDRVARLLYLSSETINER